MASHDHESGVAAGEKHQTQHDSPGPKKRTKTDTQASMEGYLAKSEQEENRGPEDGEEEEAEKEEEEASEKETKKKSAPASESAVRPNEEPDVPASILEKGIIYFFIRGRVGIDEPSDVDEIARSYILLRPIEKDAGLGKGPIGDAGNARLLALPKKVLPLSGKDRFMVFVEKGGVSFDELKESFFPASDYETKTAGTRHKPAPAPVGEGIYAITSTGRESHLAYMLTLPEKLEPEQKGLGLKEKGSFILSTKNPKYAGPASARLPEGPGFSKEIIDEFRSLRWIPTKPAHLDYPNAQVLLVGESSGIEKAVQPRKEDKEKAKEMPEEALENLAEEDLERMRHLPGDQLESIFADFQVE